MRTSVLQENLAKGLSFVSRAVENRPTLPVLGNILLATEDARLRLSATNIEMSITTWIGAWLENRAWALRLELLRLALNLPTLWLAGSLDLLVPDARAWVWLAGYSLVSLLGLCWLRTRGSTSAALAPPV